MREYCKGCDNLRLAGYKKLRFTRQRVVVPFRTQAIKEKINRPFQETNFAS